MIPQPKLNAKKLVCENLYYPDSYDPVNTTVDSVFYNYLTDVDCLNAAIELIEMPKKVKRLPIKTRNKRN